MFTCSVAPPVHTCRRPGYPFRVFGLADAHCGSIDGCAGEAVVPYMGPRPPVGIHRYVMVVFQQKARMTAPPALAPGAEAARVGFTTRAFADRHDLGLPVAAMYFNAQKEPANRRRNY